MLIALCASLSIAGFRLGLIDMPYAYLQRHQLDKLQPWTAPPGESEPAPILFLGDSSLGNAIDAGVVRELTGRPALNLALTGAYGYAGTYNLLRRVVELRKPELVVVMHTVEMMTRDVSYLGDIYTAPDLPLGRVPPASLATAYLNLTNLANIVETLAESTAQRPEPQFLAGDYIRQEPESYMAGEASSFEPILPEALNPDKTLYLERIAAICREHGLDCRYAHGPIYDRHCRESRAYIEAASASVRAAGLPVVEGTPACIPAAEVGDEADHIAPEAKAPYTRLFLQQIGWSECRANRTLCLRSNPDG